MRRFLVRLLPLGVVLALVLPATTLAANTKYEFEDVTFSDGTTGVIYAGVKVTNKSTVVVCDYESAGHMAYLGEFQEINGTDVPATADEALAFCQDHFADRTV